MKKADTSKKMQVQSRPKRIMTPNDKLTRTLFNLPENEFVDMILNGADNFVTENPKSRNSTVKTKFWIENVGTVELSKPLDEFDRAVFDVCISAREDGFDGITVDTVWRTMTGGKDNNTKIRPAQKEAVFESVKRLMSIRITVDFSQACAKMKQYCGAGKKLVSTILPCKYVDGVTVCGQPNHAVIYFLDESALVTIARVKQQLLTYDAELLNVPNQNNTPLVAKLKSYLVRRVHEIKAHNMTPTITFADVFEKSGLVEPARWQRQDARKTIVAVLEHLKAHGVIRDFEFEKVSGVYRAVQLTY